MARMAASPQFSLRMMFAAVTAIAAALGALVPAPSWHSGLAMMLPIVGLLGVLTQWVLGGAE